MKRGRPRQIRCLRGHLRVLSCNRHGHCKACRRIREKDARAHVDMEFQSRPLVNNPYATLTDPARELTRYFARAHAFWSTPRARREFP